ncbi:hypothetical protein WJX72_002154 [[Myrmecia] bisecta]|uniref:Fungal lipase-type domain-containing protein n=1 Tax=[Myrmecia] bisecta TaxID=41462 RepID=A0AAW1PZU3_9CHLO
MPAAPTRPDLDTISREGSVTAHGRSNAAWGGFLMRVLLWPAFLVRSIALLPHEFVYDEPNSEAARQGSVSLLLLYHALVINVALAFVQFFKADFLLQLLSDRLARSLASFGGKYETAGGQQVALSLVNAMDPSFETVLQYEPLSQFPFAADAEDDLLPHDDPSNAHFMAVCARLAYEDKAVIKDVVTKRWGFRWSGSQLVRLKSWHCGSDRQASPSTTGWYAFSNQRAIVLVFRGSNPLDLVNWQMDIDLSLTKRPGMGGVHDGFFAALFSLPQDAQQCVFDAVLSAIYHQVVDHSKTIFVGGHGMGGALASVFAQALHVKRAEISNRVSGIYTYGAPRVGDEDFVERFYTTYHNKSYRYVHAADVVPKVPAGSGYTHHPCERFIRAFPLEGERVLKAEILADEIESWRHTEARMAFSHAFRKLVASLRPTSEDSWLCSFCRFSTLLLPGLTDHFPCEYDRALREDVRRAPLSSSTPSTPVARPAAGSFQQLYTVVGREELSNAVDAWDREKAVLDPNTPEKGPTLYTPTHSSPLSKWPVLSHNLLYQEEHS